MSPFYLILEAAIAACCLVISVRVACLWLDSRAEDPRANRAEFTRRNLFH